jgi:hypothetical protein
MPYAAVTTFIMLCISAPWIARKWGWRGITGWVLAALVFIISALLMLD